MQRTAHDADATAQDCRQNKAASHITGPSRASVTACKQTILTAHQHSFKAPNADAMAQDCRQNKAASHKIEPSRALDWPCEHQIAQ